VCVLQCCDLYHVPHIIIFVRFEVLMTVSGNITVAWKRYHVVW